MSFTRYGFFKEAYCCACPNNVKVHHFHFFPILSWNASTPTLGGRKHFKGGRKVYYNPIVSIRGMILSTYLKPVSY
jgi:hypothetical protein